MNVQKSIHFSVEKQEFVRKYYRIKIPLIMATKDIISISKLNLTYVQVLNIQEIKSRKNSYVLIKDAMNSLIESYIFFSKLISKLKS